jgi:TolB-like protein/DNA-binding winged helix-turn-helix (wHTH) protein/Tfp pilus assembly protein PilF
MESTAQRRIARFGVFEADFDTRQLTKSGFRIRLQDKPFQILARLLECQGQVVTREDLKEKLWPGNTFVEFDDGLNTAIKKLRAALGDSADNPRFVETVPRIGYRFVAPVALSSALIASAVVPEMSPTGVDASDPSSATALEATPPPALRPAGASAPQRWLIFLTCTAVATILLILGFAIPRQFKSATSGAPSGSIQAIAVLPLLNVSPDSSQEYFADGMTDEIITDLAKLAGPKVISRTSAMQYKGTRRSLPEIARELHVGAILEGSVERSGDRMRVRVQLIEASTDQHLWAETYDRQLSDVLLLEAELAQDIARQIAVRLTPQQQQSLARNRTLNPQAFQDYLQGRHYWAMRTEESLTRAVEYFERAIQEDPNDARSYAGLAQCYVVLPMLTRIPQAEAYPKARDAATRALALDNSLAEAHLSIAEIRFYLDWDFTGAEKEFRQTLALNPNYSTGHQWYGEFLSIMGRHAEAIRELQAALILDPLSGVVHLQYGNSLAQARQYGQALDQYNEALKVDPKFAPPFDAIYWTYRRQGKFMESIPPMRTALQLWDSKGDLAALVDKLPEAYSAGGKAGYLRQCIRIHEHLGRHWLYLARDYADLNDREAALESLNRSYQNREVELLWLLVDPELDPLRSDPRFQDLTRRIGFPQNQSATSPASGE